MDKEKTFKERLVDELNYQGISNKEFAAKIGISISTLNMYLYRGSIPAADVAVKMAQILNTTTEYLVTGILGDFVSEKQSIKADWQKNKIKVMLDELNAKQLEHFLEIAQAYKAAVSES